MAIQLKSKVSDGTSLERSTLIITSSGSIVKSNPFNDQANIYGPSQNNSFSVKVHSKAWYIPIVLAYISVIGLLIYIPIKKAYKITTLVVLEQQQDTVKKVSYLVSGFNAKESPYNKNIQTHTGIFSTTISINHQKPKQS